MKNTFLKFGFLVKQKIIESDLYPKVISFTWDGKTKFKTFFGGIVALIIRLIVLLIFISLVVTIFKRENLTYTVTNTQKDLTNDSEKHYFAQNDVYFAFYLRGPNPGLLFDPSYLTFEISQISYIIDNSTAGYSVRSTPIPYEFWGSRIPFVKKSIYDRLNLYSYVCPKDTNFFLRANFNSDNYESVQIRFSKCIGNYWKSDAEIANVLNTNIVSFAIISSFFESNDFENPVYHYLQDSNEYIMSMTLTEFVTFTVNRNNAYLEDSIYFGSQGSSDAVSFYSINQKNLKYAGADPAGTLLNVMISIDQQINQYRRTVYSFFDMFGYIGGIFGMLSTFGQLIVEVFATRIFYARVISHMQDKFSHDIVTNQAHTKINKRNEFANKTRSKKKNKRLVMPEPLDKNKEQIILENK